MDNKSFCSFCSRMKRGIIYSTARKENYNVIALAQHLDDLAESFLMSAFHGGQLNTMKANYVIDAGDLRVIRPLIYARERQTQAFSEDAQLPVIPENCPACFEMPTQRFYFKQLLNNEEKNNPGVYKSLLSAMRPLISKNNTRDHPVSLALLINQLALKNFLTKLSLGLLSFLPLSFHHRLGELAGYLLFVFKNRNKHIAQVNIGICFTSLNDIDKQKLLKRTLKENGKTLIECFWLWRHPASALSALLGNVKNHNLLKRASKQGTIFVTPHFGSWEFIGLLTAANSDLLILYAPPKSEHIELLSCRGRSSTGGTVISTNELNAKHLIRHIKNGGSVGILPDQVPEGNGGVYSSFYGRQTYTSTLVCKLAKKITMPSSILLCLTKYKKFIEV